MIRTAAEKSRSRRSIRALVAGVALAFVAAGPAAADHRDHDRRAHHHGHEHKHGHKHHRGHGHAHHGRHAGHGQGHGHGHRKVRRSKHRYERAPEPRTRVVYRDAPSPAPPRSHDARPPVSTGGLVGAAVGGLVGAQLGKGDGKLATTAAGAIAGYLLGERIERTRQEGTAHTPRPERPSRLTRTSWR